MEYLMKEMKEKSQKVLYKEPCLCVVPEEDGGSDSKSETDSQQTDEKGTGQRPELFIYIAVHLYILYRTGHGRSLSFSPPLSLAFIGLWFTCGCNPCEECRRRGTLVGQICPKKQLFVWAVGGNI